MKSQFLVKDNEGEVVLYGVTLREATTYIEENNEQAPFEVFEIEATTDTKSNYLH